MTVGRGNKAFQLRETIPQAQALYTFTILIIFTRCTSSKNLSGRTALRRNTSFPRSSLRNENWSLKPSERNSCPTIFCWRNEGRQSCGRERGWLEQGELSQLHAWQNPPWALCCQLATSPQPSLPYRTPISSCSPREAMGTGPGALGQKPAWQHGWKNEEASDRAAFSCTQNNAAFIPSHHSALLAQGSGPCRHPEPQGEDGVTCEQNLSKWWLVSNASKEPDKKEEWFQHWLPSWWRRKHCSPSQAAEHAALTASLGLLTLQSKSKFHSLIKCWFLPPLAPDTFILHPGLTVIFQSASQTKREFTAKITQISQQHQGGTYCNFKNEAEAS